MSVSVQETTVKGDSFGFSSASDSTRTNEATRTFTISVFDEGNYIHACLDALPKKGDLHPRYLNTYVDSVTCTAHDSDPNVYLAVVNYKARGLPDSGVEDDEEEPEEPKEPEYPWEQSAVISIKTNASIMQVNEFAYAQGLDWLPAMNTFDPIEGVLTGDIEAADSPTYRITNSLQERPQTLPEEPETTLQITASFAVQRNTEGADTLQYLLGLHNTVNYDDLMFIPDLPTFRQFTCCMSDITATEETYSFQATDDAPVETFAYWAITITFEYKRNTWFRLVPNESFNKLVTNNDGTISKVHIQAKQPDSDKDPSSSGGYAKITEQTRIDDCGYPMDYDAQGNRVDPPPVNKLTYVKPYLTKRPANWDRLGFIIAWE